MTTTATGAPGFNAARVEAGLKDGSRLYDLRHSAASLWLHEGRSLVEVAAWLGHAPIMTLDTYAHLIASWTRTTSGAQGSRKCCEPYPIRTFRAPRERE